MTSAGTSWKRRAIRPAKSWRRPTGRRSRCAPTTQARGQADYERIVGNADVEIALARQRAVEEAASRMGEIVMEVVERVIGREVSAEAHRDLIDEAVDALRADTAGGAAAAGAGAHQ